VAKCHSLPHGLYTPLSTSQGSWPDASVDFVVGLPRTQSDKDSIMAALNRFSKIKHFLPCHKGNDTSYVVHSYFKEVVRLHGIPLSIVSDHESKFLSHFLIIMWRKLGNKLKFSTTYQPKMDGQMEVVIHARGTLLRFLVKKNLKA